MSSITALVSSLMSRTPLTGTFGKIGAVEAEPLQASALPSEKCELRVEGMTCGACVESIEGMLREQAGIHAVKVALLAERAIVDYDPAIWDSEKLINEISDIGFEATLIPITRSDTVILRIYGMTCGSCTSTVESGLRGIPGVNNVSVSLIAETAEIEFERLYVGPRELVERVEEMGFDAMLADQGNATQMQSLTRTKEIREWSNRFKWSLAFALPVFFLSMLAPRIPFLKLVVGYRLIPGIYLGDLIVFAIVTPAQFWLGAKFYRNAYKSLKHGSATMDVLVMLGTSAAYFYSLITLILAPFNAAPNFRPFLFFETSTMLIMFVSLGRFLENRAKGKTSAALTDLMSLAPSMATIYTDAPTCSQEKRIPTELVQVGDTVKIVPGDKVPADGTLLSGSSSVDESAVTGEPVPALKQVGDGVIGGTVNGLGTFDMIVTRAGKDTALAQIVRLVEDAQTSKAPIQAFADRVAGFFVPTVIGLALATLLTWLILSHALADSSLPMMFHKNGASKLAVCLQMCISVIVVACPCALGLSTPTAIMVGTGMGAKNGILIKGGRALEASRFIRRVVLDKTGTVTQGKLTVASVLWAGSVSLDESPSTTWTSDLNGACADATTSRANILAVVSALEARSEHPLAKAVALYGKELLSQASSLKIADPIIEEFESITGSGIKGKVRIGGQQITLFIGTSQFILQSDTRYLPSSLSTFEEQESSLGRSTILVSLISSATSSVALPILAISMADAPRPSSAQAIRALQDMGIEVNMMTGDGQSTALAIAKQVGIHPDGVWSRMSPKGKAAKLTELIEKYGHGVAMVGDGINDSPALVAATVGISLSTGTSVAVEAADIVLMRSDLLDVVAALHLSQSIFAVIRRNLLWACIYNVLGLPLAMGLFTPLGLYMHPMLAGAAMAFSSVSVVASSLLLKRWIRPASSLMPGETIKRRTLTSEVISFGSNIWDNLARAASSRPNTSGYSQVPMEMT